MSKSNNDFNGVYGLLAAVVVHMDELYDRPSEHGVIDDVDAVRSYYTYCAELVTDAALDPGFKPGDLPILLGAIDSSNAAMRAVILRAVSNSSKYTHWGT